MSRWLSCFIGRKREKSCLENLPNEILLYIVDYLSAHDAYYGLFDLNKRWKSLLKQSRTRIYLIYWKMPQIQFEFLLKILTINAIDVSRIVSLKLIDRNFHQLISNWDFSLNLFHLYSFRLSVWSPGISIDNLTKFLSCSCSHLTDLRVHIRQIRNVRFNWIFIESLVWVRKLRRDLRFLPELHVRLYLSESSEISPVDTPLLADDSAQVRLDIHIVSRVFDGMSMILNSERDRPQPAEYYWRSAFNN